MSAQGGQSPPIHEVLKHDHPLVYRWLMATLVDPDEVWRDLHEADPQNALGILRQLIDGAVAAHSADYEASMRTALPDDPRAFQHVVRSEAWRKLAEAGRVTSVAEAVAPAEQWLVQTFAEQDRADNAAAVVLAAGGPDLIRGRSFVVIRCKDCRAMPIAHVAVVEGRLLLWGRLQGGRDHYVWVEPESRGVEVWCRQRAYMIPFDAPLRQFLESRRTKKRYTARVSHSGHRGSMPLE